MSRLAAVAVLAALCSAVAAGCTARATDRALDQGSWAQTLDTDRSVIDADMVSARAAAHSGDNPEKFLAYCHTDVQAYNADATAASDDLPDGYTRQLNPSKECTP